MKLVIVESPAKAKTIEKYLGKGFVVRASVGHIRDLPKSNKDAVDIEGGFVPRYQIVPEKQKVIDESYLKALPADRAAKDKSDITGVVCLATSKNTIGTASYSVYTCTQYQPVVDAYLVDIKSGNLASY